jgi:hypothetical protein
VPHIGQIRLSGKMAIKVSQATIDKIKKMGMTAALKSAPKANAEMTEGLRRMYGQRRLTAATAKMAPKPTDSRFSGVKKADPKKPTDSRFTGVKKAAPKPTDSRFSGTKPATTKASTVKKAAAPAQKTKPRFGGFSMAAGAFTPDWKKREQAAKAAKKSK